MSICLGVAIPILHVWFTMTKPCHVEVRQWGDTQCPDLCDSLMKNQPTFSWTVFPNCQPIFKSERFEGRWSMHFPSLLFIFLVNLPDLWKNKLPEGPFNSNSNSNPGLWCTCFCGLSFPHVLGPFDPSSPTSMDWLNGNISTWNIHETMAIFPLDQSNWGFPTWSIHPFIHKIFHNHPYWPYLWTASRPQKW